MTLATSASHKAIGRQYLCSGLLFLLLGMIGPVLLRSLDPPVEYNDDPREPYNFFMTTHGTMLVFFGIVPLLFSGFGNYVIPVGRWSEMYFPRINFTGLILFYLGSGFLVVSLIARSQATLAMAMALNISSSLICSVNFAATFLRLHRSGMNWNKMSFMVLTVLATAILLFINFVPLGAAAIMQLANDFQRLESAPPSSRILSYQPVPVFWHHVLWFMGHPEVYILVLFILGLMVEGFKSLFKKKGTGIF